MTAEQYIDELLREKQILEEQPDFGHAVRLLDTEIQNVRMNNDETYQNPAHAVLPPLEQGQLQGELYKEDVVEFSEKIMLPVDENPRFNFVGKIIGPKGSTMKAIQSVSQARIMVLGKGSTRDRDEEERLCLSDEVKYGHFKEPLHIVINVRAPRSEAHEQLAIAMEEINKSLAAENEAKYQSDMGSPQEHPLTPIIKIGIPPPGAIILNSQTTPAVSHVNDNGGRGRGRGRGCGSSHGQDRSRPY